MTELYVALDFDQADKAWAFAHALDPKACGIKIGKELFTTAGPEFVRRCVQHGFKVFLDLKFHDIPSTVAGAVKASVDLGVAMLNVHASGGLAMMRAAKQARDAAVPTGAAPPILIAVTVLTSLNAHDCEEIGFARQPGEQVMHLAKLTRAAALDGVVCSPHEAASLRAEYGPDFFLCTPGVRLAGESTHDQQRVLTPAQAREAGVHAIVMGRSFTQSQHPQEVLAAVLREIRS